MSTRSLFEVAADLGLGTDEIVPWGRDMAKLAAVPQAPERHGKLVLVSAISPTSAGEGKTTTSIGLSNALRKAGKKVCLTLREPSLGPLFGRKGGGTGGGKSQLFPADRINMHFTGDMHAVSAAHNLIAATVDSALFFGKLPATATGLTWRRVVDMNDRALRNMVIGLGGSAQGIPRESGFDITAASELMAVLGLATDEDDLRRRIDAIIVGTADGGAPIRVADLGITGAVMAVLRDAILPNLVQTTEGTPALVHGGPFANIAHGCSSVLGDRAALARADYVVTEAGFGFDLGGEKFYDLKVPVLGVAPSAVVLVASVRALALHGSGDVRAGLDNLAAHLDSLAHVGARGVVAINRMDGDAESDLEVIRGFCAERKVPVAMCEHFQKGGEGALALAEAVIDAAGEPVPGRFCDADAPIADKLESIVANVYGGDGVLLHAAARATLRRLESWNLGHLPVCVAKTPASLTDDPGHLGRPHGFKIRVRDFELAAGAGFVIALCGSIMRMPGLPKAPNATSIDLRGGEIVGLS